MIFTLNDDQTQFSFPTAKYDSIVDRIQSIIDDEIMEVAYEIVDDPEKENAVELAVQIQSIVFDRILTDLTY